MWRSLCHKSPSGLSANAGYVLELQACVAFSLETRRLSSAGPPDGGRDVTRRLMKELYEPRNYYQRIRTFLEHNRPSGPRLRLAWSDFQAFLKSLWLLGVWPSLLAILPNGVAQAASPVPPGHRTYHHRSSLSSRSQVAVNRRQLT